MKEKLPEGEADYLGFLMSSLGFGCHTCQETVVENPLGITCRKTVRKTYILKFRAFSITLVHTASSYPTYCMP